MKELKQSNDAQGTMNKKLGEMQAENSRTVTHLRKTISDQTQFIVSLENQLNQLKAQKQRQESRKACSSSEPKGA
jgi:hypothetical protein